MKQLLITLLIIGGFTNTGTYIFGFSIYKVIGIATEWKDDVMIDCTKWAGEQRECTIDDRYLMQSLYNLYNN